MILAGAKPLIYSILVANDDNPSWHDISEHASFDMFNGEPHYVHLEAEPAEPEPTGDDRIRFSRNSWLRKVPHKLTFKQVPLHQIHTYLRKYNNEN